MPRVSAGLLLYRRSPSGLRVLLVHPGGPFWRARDLGAWTIPKGEVVEGEPPLDAARREFTEETGWVATGEAMPLGHIRQRAGKTVHAWALEGEADTSTLRSNTFEMEWPSGSGTTRAFPEVDRAEWFDLAEARRRILPAQTALLDALVDRLKSASSP